MSLRTKLVLRVAGVLGVGLTLLSILVHLLLQTVLTREVDELLIRRSSLVIEEMATSEPRGAGDLSAQSAATGTDEFSSPGVYVQVVALDGAVVTRSPNLGAATLPLSAEVLSRSRAGETAFVTVPLDTGERVRIHIQPLLAASPPRIVQVGQSLHFIDSAVRGADAILGAAGLATFALALTFTWVSVGRMLAALSRITMAAESIAESGDVERPIPDVPTNDETGRLARALQRTTTRLRHLLETQRNLLADTAHELRNPLTVMHTNLDLLRLDIDRATREEVADESLAEADRMRRLVDDLLLLAEVEGQDRRIEEDVRLDELARSAVASMEDRVGQRTLTIDAPAPLVVRGNAEQLRRVVLNLLENAFQYGGEQAEIAVSVRRAGRRGHIIVLDNGPGIAPEHLPHIFDRFYRVDPSRRRSTGGTGLGLAIVREIVTAHQGTVSVRSSETEGSTFDVSLPAEPSWTPLTEVDTAPQST